MMLQRQQGPGSQLSGCETTVQLPVPRGLRGGLGACGPRKGQPEAATSGLHTGEEADGGEEVVQFSGAPFCGQPSKSVKMTTVPSGAIMACGLWDSGSTTTPCRA